MAITRYRVLDSQEDVKASCFSWAEAYEYIVQAGEQGYQTSLWTIDEVQGEDNRW